MKINGGRSPRMLYDAKVLKAKQKKENDLGCSVSRWELRTNCLQACEIKSNLNYKCGLYRIHPLKAIIYY